VRLWRYPEPLFFAIIILANTRVRRYNTYVAAPTPSRLLLPVGGLTLVWQIPIRFHYRKARGDTNSPRVRCAADIRARVARQSYAADPDSRKFRLFPCPGACLRTEVPARSPMAAGRALFRSRLVDPIHCRPLRAHARTVRTDHFRLENPCRRAGIYSGCDAGRYGSEPPGRGAGSGSFSPAASRREWGIARRGYVAETRLAASCSHDHACRSRSHGSVLRSRSHSSFFWSRSHSSV